MSDTITRLKESEAEVQSLKDKKSRMDGRREQLMVDLKGKFGVDTLKDGQTLLDRKQKTLKGIDTEMLDLQAEMDGIIETAKG